MCDLFDDAIFEAKLRRLAGGFQKRFGDLLTYNVDDEIARYKVRLPERNVRAPGIADVGALGPPRKAGALCGRPDSAPRLRQREER